MLANVHRKPRERELLIRSESSSKKRTGKDWGLILLVALIKACRKFMM